MSVKEVAEKLGVELQEEENGEYTVNLESSNQFNKLLNKMDKGEDFVEDDSSVSFEESFIKFVCDDEVEVTLTARFVDDEYSISFREMSEDDSEDN